MAKTSTRRTSAETPAPRKRNNPRDLTRRDLQPIRDDLVSLDRRIQRLERGDTGRGKPKPEDPPADADLVARVEDLERKLLELQGSQGAPVATPPIAAPGS